MENIAKKNMDNQKARISSDLLEMDKPMARSVDDEDRDAHLKAVEREEDPMLQYIRKKKTQKQASSGLPRKLLISHSALKLEKKCNFKSTKTHYLHFQKCAKNQFLHQKKV